MKKLHRIGKFYKGIIMKNIGIFIFIGLLSVVFHDHGWFPDENMYAISQLAYQTVVPVLIAYEGGRTVGGQNGGILAVLAIAGMMPGAESSGILGAMLAGPFAGFIWKYEKKIQERWVPSGLQMLVKNLCLGVTGGVLAMTGFYLAAPAAEFVTSVFSHGILFLAEHGMIGALSLVIEPGKVFFLNNLMNHAILVPLGMKQVQETGSSLLFLLETNPGPGFGVLAALYCAEKKRRGEYASALFAEAAGGIHEVYFPFILSNLYLLIPLILGGAAGNLCFWLWDAGLQGAVSPGSIITVMLMAGREMALPVFAGILVSAMVSFGVSFVILRINRESNSKREKEEMETAQMRTEEMQTEEMQTEEMQTEDKPKLEWIVFVCDGGVGSSAMGAAIFRRKLAAGGIQGIRAEACAADMVPEGAQLLVCQRDFCRMLPEKLRMREIYAVESLVKTDEYDGLTDLIQKRNGGK